MALLSVSSLSVHFHTRRGVVRAVEDVSWQLEEGETLGIVGESGSGKSVSCQSLLGLLPSPPARIAGGSALFEGVDLLRCPPRRLRRIRGNRIAFVFQDPLHCLNPYLTIAQQLGEVLRVHQRARNRRQIRNRVVESLEAVALPRASECDKLYPHHLSGGQRQRVAIAMALLARPALLIADEPTTALDVITQAQILALMGSFRKIGTASIFISHDIGVIAAVADRVLIMYAGRVLETASTQELLLRPRHPYTQALLDSLPVRHQAGEKLAMLPGQPPDPMQPTAGCVFHPRCSHVHPSCRQQSPPLQEVAARHSTACLRVQQGEITLHSQES